MAVLRNDTVPRLTEADLNVSGLEEAGTGDNELMLEVLMPWWEVLVTVASLGVIIVLTIVGNVLVILSVFTYRPLRIVQNFFIVSLAVADLTVAVFVLPFNVAYSILGKWIFGIHLCQMWLTCDILCCTASILNLCAIALDRYWAITDPIAYAQKRTLNRVLIMIGLVWAVSVLICLPPLFGWNDWPDHFTQETPCILTQERGFVIYSSAGSFFVPLLIMASVYFKIFTATRRRLRERANAYASKINQISLSTSRVQREEDSAVSESRQNGYTCKNFFRKKSGRMTESATTSTIPSLTPPQPATVTETSVAEYELSQSRDEASSADEVQSSDVVVRVNPGQDGSQIHQFIEEKQRISLSKERRAARTLGIIMGSFVVCWLPFFLMYIILPFCSTCPMPNDKLINFIVWLGYVNSSLNPIIYTIFNLEFRKAFARLLRCSRTVMI